MRTTLTLDPDVEALVRRLMAERHLTFKAAVNEAIRAGLRPGTPRQGPGRTRTFAMGVPAVPVTKALALAADLEDDELVRRLATGK